MRPEGLNLRDAFTFKNNLYSIENDTFTFLETELYGFQKSVYFASANSRYPVLFEFIPGRCDPMESGKHSIEGRYGTTVGRS